jgi:glycosyltransferase involved in cell wall biosynthesis
VVLLEAMAANTAVVASDLPGYRNAARPGRDGMLVRPGDVEALAGALGEVLHEPEVSVRLVAAGRDRAAHFAMDRLADLYLELFERVLRERGRRRRRTW